MPCDFTVATILFVELVSWEPFIIACSTVFAEGIVERCECLTSCFSLIVEMMLDSRPNHLHPNMPTTFKNRPLRYREFRIGERADRYRYNAWKTFVFIENGRATGGTEEIGGFVSTLPVRSHRM